MRSIYVPYDNTWMRTNHENEFSVDFFLKECTKYVIEFYANKAVRFAQICEDEKGRAT